MTDIVGIRGYEQVVKQTQNILFDLTSYINYIIYKFIIWMLTLRKVKKRTGAQNEEVGFTL